MWQTNYREEYCGWGGGAGGGGGGGKKKGPTLKETCSATYEAQPVGGINQARRDETMRAQLPVYDEDHVAMVYGDSERGTHRVRPAWRDSRWSEPTRAANSTLYLPADRDPAKRKNPYVYRTTLVDAMATPQKPLTVPDVHKLRYMQNQYMSYDDWYQ